MKEEESSSFRAGRMSNEMLSIKGNVYMNNREITKNTECSTYNDGNGKIIFKK